MMAIPEYDEYSSAVDSAPDLEGDGAVAQGGTVPVPATDYLSGACALTLQPTQLQNAVLCARAQRVTSVTGSPQLDFISSATVHGEHTESRAVRVVPNPEGDVEAQEQSITETLSSPCLVLSSIKADTETSVSQHETGPIRQGASSTGLPCRQTQTAECRQRVTGVHTSGYASRSADYCAQGESRNQRSAVPSTCSSSSIGPSSSRRSSSSQSGVVSPGCRAIQFSKPGINDTIVRSGTNRQPCFPEFCSLPSRICSFQDLFLLDGAHVNKDLLARAGFFYKRAGEGHVTVVCFHCGCSPREWRDGQEPLTEHRMLSPYCKALPRVLT